MKGKRKGRVSYQLLSINQLGAVYEALLAYRGFFATEDLYEVQPAPKKAAKADDDADETDEDGDADGAGSSTDLLDTAWFVPESRIGDTNPGNAFTTPMNSGTRSCGSTRRIPSSTARPAAIAKRAPATTPRRSLRARGQVRAQGTAQR